MSDEVTVVGAMLGPCAIGERRIKVRRLGRAQHEINPVIEVDGRRHLLHLDGQRTRDGEPIYTYVRELGEGEPDPVLAFAHQPGI